jgi:hypothetical protein
MKTSKLIKVTDEHYVIVDDSIKAKAGEYALYFGVVTKKILDADWTSDRKITHSTQPFNFDLIEPIDLSEVQEAIQGYSIEQMKADFANNELSSENGLFGNFFSLSTSFESGFNESQELLKDKYVLSVDQMYELIAFVIERKDYYSRVDILEQFNSIVLDKKEWDCYFENDKLVVL